MGFVLVAKIYFENTYDTFFADADRIYRVTENVTVDGEYRDYKQTAGAIAPGLKRYVPQVEAATRHTSFVYNVPVRLDDGRVFSTDGIQMADSCFFDVLTTDILAGNPHDVLAVADWCMIPRSLAEKIGGDVVGLSLCSPNISEDYKVTVGGVYEDFPLNSVFPNAIYLSLATLPKFSVDGRDNWVGNDRYLSYVRLAPGTTPDDIKGNIRTMLEANVEREDLDLFHYGIGVTPLVGLYSSLDEVKTMSWMLSLLAIILLVGAGLNYLLIVIGQMGARSKEMAVRKCYGTGNGKIFMRILGESLFYLVVSVVLAVLLVFCFSGTCFRLLGYTPAQLFCTGRVWAVEVLVCLLLLLLTGVVPAWMYCRTKVSTAFRSNVRSRRGWKMALLAVQFFAAGMLLCLLMLVGRQYARMTGADMGYDYENIGYAELSGIPQESRRAIVEELKRIGVVEGVASSDHDFTQKTSGNNVWLGDNIASQINVSDMYRANPEIFDVLGLKMLQGAPFWAMGDSIVRQVVVEERFVDVLAKLSGKDESHIVGRPFCITEHGSDGNSEFVVCGVIANTLRGGFGTDAADTRAGVMFPGAGVYTNLYVRFTELTPEALHAAQDVLARVCPTREVYITPYRNNVNELSASVRQFGLAVSIAGIAILIISLIGLVGFTADEVQRRAREIAIRKVTGTSASKIVGLFCRDAAIVAVPSLMAGAAVAIIIGRQWLSQFTDQVSLSPLSMVLCVIVLLLIVIAVVIINSYKVARSNPVDHLRCE